MIQYMPNGDVEYSNGINVNVKCPDVDINEH